MLSNYHINNVTIHAPRLVQVFPLECLVAAGESDRDVGKRLAVGGADTCVVGSG